VNLPNLITLTRLLVTGGAIGCLEAIDDPERAAPTLGWWAFGLFLFAAVTDFVDGWLARRFGQVTAFGRVADPFADKVLICGVLIVLLRFPQVAALMPGWFVVVVVARELLVTTIRGVAEAQGIPFPADRLGKLKMVAQCTAAAGLLTIVAGTDTFVTVAEIALWITLVLTLLSCVGYVWKARAILFRA
jgi:CDP-diacylglycerol--glycerol-3-phosphate 3-phosphatidyltransferase